MRNTIYIDTETGPTLDQNIIKWLAKRTLDPAKSFEDNAKAQQAAYAKTSIQATLCNLAVVSLALNEGPPTTFVQDAKGEADLVQRVADEFRHVIDEVGRCQIVAYNADFDRAVLRTRAMRHRIRLPYSVHGLDQKPWESAWKCAMTPLKKERSDNVSLEQACVAFGIPLSFDEAGDLPGKEVGMALARGEIARVAKHCEMDVIRLREVWRHIRSVEDEQPEEPDEEKVRGILKQLATRGEVE